MSHNVTIAQFALNGELMPQPAPFQVDPETTIQNFLDMFRSREIQDAQTLFMMAGDQRMNDKPDMKLKDANIGGDNGLEVWMIATTADGRQPPRGISF